MPIIFFVDENYVPYVTNLSHIVEYATQKKIDVQVAVPLIVQVMNSNGGNKIFIFITNKSTQVSRRLSRPLLESQDVRHQCRS